jgi:phosphopantothenoylcysteine decarboxylase/phosphopantothenate--cysteine ligase
LAKIKDIFFATARELLKEEFWINRKVVVSGGGTIERIDDVRYISNFSSGKMANSIALALYLKGAEVCLVTTRDTKELPSQIYTLDVESGEEMSEYLSDCIRVAKKGVMTKATLMDDSVPELIQKKPYLFMVAAVSDYKPKFPQKGKLKKEMLGEEWELKLVKTKDIVANLDKSDILTVAFKAEMDEDSGKENAKKALKSKGVDAICLNYVSKNSFGSDENEIVFITKDGEKEIKQASKIEVAKKIVEFSKELECD